jgi:hypothetical protein
MAEFILSKTARAAIRKLEAQLRTAKQVVEDIEEAIEEARCGDSPIQPDDRIEWQTGGGWNGGQIRIRRGVVIGIGSRWDGYAYKVRIMTKDWSKAIGIAKVSTAECPTLIIDEVISVADAADAILKYGEMVGDYTRREATMLVIDGKTEVKKKPVKKPIKPPSNKVKR